MSLRFTSPYIISLLTLASVLVGCGKDSSFSLLSEADSFKQTDGVANAKADILWVIDNSGSMQSSQQNVITNLNSFISNFGAKGLNFKMAVTTSDAYRSLPSPFANNPNCGLFRDRILNGSCNTVSGRPSSGYRVIDMLTPDLSSVFLINALQTDDVNLIFGSGDERVFQSMRAALDLPGNAGFLRNDSFFAVIIVSDEEDFSHNGTNLNESYSNPALHTVDSYVSYLDTLTSSTATNRRYNVSAMAIYDSGCRTALGGATRKVNTRYAALVDQVNLAHPNVETQGVKSSLCGNFATELEKIGDGILTLATSFPLARIPIEATIAVIVNGVTIPNRDTNPLADGGWFYQSETNSILFTPAYVPVSGSSIRVTYDPASYGG
jgi:hypothetical protein